MADPVIIITGASSGIGAAAARRLAHDGGRVTLVARRAAELTRLADEIGAGGGRALVAPADVRDPAAFGAAVAQTLAAWGRVDVLLNNAGLGYSERVAELNAEHLRAQVETNLLAVITCAQAVLPAMLAQRAGHIINVASIAGLIGLPGSAVYSATKFGVVGFSDGLRREVLRQGIHVTAFCPGFVATDFSPRLQQIRAGEVPVRLPGVMRAEYVAGVLAGVIRHPRRRVIIPPGWGALVWLAQTCPTLTDVLLSRFLGQAEKGQK